MKQAVYTPVLWVVSIVDLGGSQLSVLGGGLHGQGQSIHAAALLVDQAQGLAGATVGLPCRTCVV